MPLQNGPGAMADWPIDWKLGLKALNQVIKQVETLGLNVWDNGDVLFPNPFGLGSLRCRLEVWTPGIVFRFRDKYKPAIVPWLIWEEIVTQGYPRLRDYLLACSHPLRFSPYNFHGAGLYLDRRAELSLLLSKVSGLQLVGASGMGKTSLFVRAAKEAGGEVICCHAYTPDDLAKQLHQLQGRQPGGFIFLDEMDKLIQNARVINLLRALGRENNPWRISLHREVAGLGVIVKLPSPKGLGTLLGPLEQISGQSLDSQLKKVILDISRGNPRSLQYLCHSLLEEMGEQPRKVDFRLVKRVIYRALGEGLLGQRIAQVV